jgi:uncharacterized protein YggE
MTGDFFRFVMLSFLASQTFSMTFAQMAGSRGGVTNQSAHDGLASLSKESVESFITVEGRAEVRLKPTQIRIVLAVTHQGATAQECQAAVKKQVGALRGAWEGVGIRGDKIVEDFIAVLPTYSWDIEKKGERNANVEKQTGYKMQVNLHVSVANDEAASAALNAAFEQGVTDIIGFDYFNPELDLAKAEARQRAIEAAKAKADVILAVFPSKPPVINVQEETVVRRPESLYESFANAVEGEIQNGWRDHNLPTFHAPRPKNTYYKGYQSSGDVSGSALPMKMEISVVSSVRIYYESPAAAKRVKEEAKK